MYVLLRSRVESFFLLTNFLRAQLGTQKMGNQNQIVGKIETLLFVLYYLNRTCIIVILQTYPSKDAQKNMVKA